MRLEREGDKLMGDGQELRLVDPEGLCRLKWEYEQYRTGYDDMIGMGTADMDYMSPEPILQAIMDIARRGHLGYPMIPDEYYDAIHDWLLRQAGWDINAMDSVCRNSGIYISAWSAIDVLTKPGDKIVIFTPVHFCFKRMIDMNHRVTIECPLIQIDGRYTINPDALEACLSSGARLIWICNPHNPVGRAWTPKELQAIADLAERYDVQILSDDVYSGLTFPGVKYTPIASLSKEISYRTVTLCSTSKTFNTTALLHSYIVAENPETMKLYKESMDSLDLRYSTDIMGIYALIAAYRHCDGWLANVRRQLQKNYQTIADYCQEHIPMISVAKADSTYFAWIDMRKLGINPQQLRYELEREEHIIPENGLRSGKGGSGFIRLNTATSEENIINAMRRLEHFCRNHG